MSALHPNFIPGHSPIHDLVQTQMLSRTLRIAFVDFLRQFLKGRTRTFNIQTLILILTENLREIIWYETTKDEIRIRDRKRTTFSVAIKSISRGVEVTETSSRYL